MLESEYSSLNQTIVSISGYMAMNQRGKKIAEIKKSLDATVKAPTTILVCGEFKRGKSTFVNALIGRNVCPTDTDICTAVVSILKYGNKEKVTRTFGDFSNLRTETIDIDDIEKYTVGSAADIDNTICLEIELPLEELKNGLVVIDTPGVGGLDPRHAALTNYFLPQADVTLFMTDVNEPLSETELNFYKDKVLEYAKHSAIIVNKADLKDPAQVEEIRQDTLSKVSTYVQVPLESIDIISVSAADCIREEKGLGNFPKLRNLISNLVKDFKCEIMSGLRDELDEQIDLAITPLQAQLSQIENPNVNKIQELSNKKNEITTKIQELGNERSPFRLKLNESITKEKDAITMSLNKKCVNFSTDGFNDLLKDSRATNDEHGGEWLGKQIYEKIDYLGSEVTLMLNKAFERIASMEEFGGMLNFKASNYSGEIVVKNVDLNIPIHKKIMSGMPGYSVGGMTLFILGTGGWVLPAALAAGGYVAIRNIIDVKTTTRENRLRQAYQPQIQAETQNLKIYVNSRFTDFHRELLRAITEKAKDYKESLNEAMQQIQVLREQTSAVVNNKLALENKIKVLLKAKNDVEGIDL